MNNKLHQLLNSTTCDPAKEIKILSLAEGNIKNEKEQLELYAHMVSCDTCRYLFEDFFLIKEVEEENEELSCDKISLKVGEKGFFPLSLSQHIPGQTAVLSKAPQKQIQFQARMGREELQLRFIMGNKFINLEVESKQKGHQFYLIQKEDYSYIETEENVVSFERLKGDNFILSDNLKNFLFISLKGIK